MYEWTSAAPADIASAADHTSRRTRCVNSTPQQRTRITVVSPLDEDLIVLLDILRQSGWAVYWWTNCADAVSALEGQVTPVVICERDLPDGNWRTLLARTRPLRNPPRLVIASRLADDGLWTEALDAGVYDVLAKPFLAGEVNQAVSLARRSWERDAARAGAPLRLVRSRQHDNV